MQARGRWWIGVLGFVAGCYQHHQASDASVPVGPCSDFVPICIRATSPCGPREQTLPVCEGTWRCPPGSWRHTRYEEPAGGCPALALAASYVGTAGVAIETSEQCLWVLDEVSGVPGAVDPAVVLPPSVPFASCPGELEPVGDTLHATVQPLADARSFSLLSSVRFRGTTYVYLRSFYGPPGSQLGFETEGSAVVVFDEVASVVPSTSEVALLEGGYELGTASLVSDDLVYVFACRGPVDDGASECILGRTDAPLDPTAMTYWDGVTFSSDVAEATPVVRAGPERFDVVEVAGRWVMVFAEAGANELRSRSAPALRGPWAEARLFLPCALPYEDGEAYCATPQIHPELMDPLQAGELAVTYAIDTRSADRERLRITEPERYWPPLVRGRVRF